MERRKTITLLVKENRTQFSPMGSLEVDMSHILSWLLVLGEGFRVTCSRGGDLQLYACEHH